MAEVCVTAAGQYATTFVSIGAATVLHIVSFSSASDCHYHVHEPYYPTIR